MLREIQEFVTGDRPMVEPDRVLATVLFTDIVDSTRRAPSSATLAGATAGGPRPRHPDLTSSGIGAA